jgi:hypothetical protein
MIDLDVTEHDRTSTSTLTLSKIQKFKNRTCIIKQLLYHEFGFLLVNLKSTLRNHDLVECYEISVSEITTDMFHLP